MPANKRNLKIGILAMASTKGGGVFQYTYSLLEALINYLKDEYNLFILKDKKFDAAYLNNYKNLVELDAKPTNSLLKILRVLYIKIPFIRKCLDVSKNYEIIKNSSINLIINPITSLAPVYVNKQYIVIIHDLQHKYYPQFFTLKQRLMRNFIYTNAAKNAAFVVCESQFVKNDINKFLDIAPDKIKVIPSPPPSYLTKLKIRKNYSKKIKKKYGLPEKFLFYPAQFWPHKNHINLIKAIELAKNRYKEKISLILIGSKKNNFENTINEIKKLGLENQVKYLGYVPDKDIPYLYKLSTALVMPTLFESVSLPIWEALCLGCPVVSSNVCALPKQIGNAGLLFNPNDIEDIMKKIHKIWIDENLRKKLVKRGSKKIKNFTLKNYAKQWEKVIDEALLIKHY